MPATAKPSPRKKSTGKPAESAKPAAAAARKRYEESSRVIDHIVQTLEAAQSDLAAIRGSVGAGAGDLRKDVTRLLRDARRDLTKMSKAVRRDLERAQKDLATAAKPATSRARRATRAKSAPKARTRGSAK